MNDLLDIRDLEVVLSLDGKRFPVAQEISLRIQRGEVLGLVGESGCGKTLTTLALTGLLPPGGALKCGSYAFDGQAVRWEEPSALSRLRGRKISYVFQEASSALDPLFTIGGQLEETLRYRSDPKGVGRGRACEILEQVGLAPAEEFFGLYPHQLSGGMCQRAMIALGLAAGADLLIADEPTSALDVATERGIVSLIQGLVRDLGLAVIWITHDLSLVKDVAGRLAVMYAGRIVETGPTARVFGSPGHPYTEALIACLPQHLRKKHFSSIPGEVPEPGALPGGCAFHPRCAFRMPVCVTKAPDFFTITPEHSARCYLRQKD